MSATLDTDTNDEHGSVASSRRISVSEGYDLQDVHHIIQGINADFAASKAVSAPSKSTSDSESTEISTQDDSLEECSDLEEFPPYSYEPIKTKKRSLRNPINVGDSLRTIFSNVHEIQYFQAGLRDLTCTLKTKTPMSQRGSTYTCTKVRDFEYKTSDNGRERHLEYDESYTYVAGHGEWLEHAWDLQESLTYEPYAKIELTHLVWSVYSWCCKQTQQETVTEAGLEQWMTERQEVLAQQCRELQMGIRSQVKYCKENGIVPIALESQTWLEGSSLRSTALRWKKYDKHIVSSYLEQRGRPIERTKRDDDDDGTSAKLPVTDLSATSISDSRASKSPPGKKLKTDPSSSRPAVPVVLDLRVVNV